MRHDPDRRDILRLSALAARQHGVLATAQALTVGVSRARFDQFVRRGIFVRAGPGVYASTGAPDSWERTLMTGLLALGPEARVSHESAARLHDFDRTPAGRVEFTVPRGHRNAVGIGRVHSTTRVGPTDVISIGSFRVTSATRTISDLARARASPQRLAAAIDSAVRLGLCSPEVLHDRLRQLRGPGRWGCRLLDDLLVDSGGHTMLEREFLRLMRTGGLPRPHTQVIHRRDGATYARVDFLFDAYGVVVEVSGRKGHSSPSERRIDAQRRNELQDAGRRVYEYTYEDVTGRPDHVLTTMRQRLRAAGWTA